MYESLFHFVQIKQLHKMSW